MSRGLQKGNRPGRKNSKHQRDTNKMGRMKERSPSALFPKNRDHDALKEQKMNGTFAQPAQSKKNKRQHPNQPERFFLLPKTQPENDRKRTKRHIKPFNFYESPFLDDTRVNQPDASGHCRSTRPQIA